MMSMYTAIKIRKTIRTSRHKIISTSEICAYIYMRKPPSRQMVYYENQSRELILLKDFMKDQQESGTGRYSNVQSDRNILKMIYKTAEQDRQL